ncbi:uncharacterized protein LOC143849910 isoform X2 [Tasmannia lanceolata]|uniref:uncharacterized protein LOC143849910 isoform X2 n=1 Tax=Tasmannia lanceolata TaxID=3420 RepID=UPI00406391BF
MVSVPDMNSVLDFLRKNGFIEAESALRDDITERGDLDLDSSSFNSHFDEFPQLRIALGRQILDGIDSNSSPKEDVESSSDSFLSIGSSGSEFENPYGLWSSARVESEDSSDRLSEFGTARDYNDLDMINNPFWYSERGEGYDEQPADLSSSPSVDKFVTTSASRGFHSVTSINGLDDPGHHFTHENSDVKDVLNSAMLDTVTDHHDWDEKIHPNHGTEEECEGCTENYSCSVPLCDCCAGVKGDYGLESVDYTHRAIEQIKDSNIPLYRCYELVCDEPKSIEAPELTTFQLNLVDESTVAVSWEQNVIYSNQGTNSSRNKQKLDSQFPKKELQIPDPLVDTRSSSTNASLEYQNVAYETGDAQEMIEESHNTETVMDTQEHGTGSELQMFENHDDEYEIFDLRIIHRKNRTGFEENKDLPIVLNTIIAGRYYVTEYLGSAAFSKVIQAHDLQTGMDVCLKVIKNDKDFFDQSLDEIKLLKYVNKHDPADECHILRLYDYFYHQEHLFIVCELLRANLYEFQKFNHDSGGEVYFTLPRMQSITRQCLEALEYLHHLGIIHCDLKPENILIKSYSRCEIKVIDLGSSCFQSDNLSLYVQSRSYRAPEVILGLPYDQKIDIWSLGCILAELFSGEVLFPNDSLELLLARMIGILGPIDMEMLVRGQETHKYFTNDYDLYHMNEETNQLEYIIPEKSSLAHHLEVSDVEFIEFIEDLLQTNPERRPTASQALQHPWLLRTYE